MDAEYCLIWARLFEWFLDFWICLIRSNRMRHEHCLIVHATENQNTPDITLCYSSSTTFSLQLRNSSTSSHQAVTESSTMDDLTIIILLVFFGVLYAYIILSLVALLLPAHDPAPTPAPLKQVVTTTTPPPSTPTNTAHSNSPAQTFTSTTIPSAQLYQQQSHHQLFDVKRHSQSSLFQQDPIANNVPAYVASKNHVASHPTCLYFDCAWTWYSPQRRERRYTATL